MDIYAVSRQLGHKQVSATQEIYAHQINEHQSKIVKRIPEIYKRSNRAGEIESPPLTPPICAVRYMKEREAELEGLSALETFDKDKLLTVIDSVQVYSEERIEIVWKMNDGFFAEIAGKKCLRYSKTRQVIAMEKT